MYSELYFRGKPVAFVKPVLFDFKQDTFYSECTTINNSTSFADILGDDVTKIHKFALSIGHPHMWYDDEYINWNVHTLLRRFTNVKSATIVDRAHGQFSGDLVELDGIYDIDGSLGFFEMEESNYYEGMEEHCTIIEQDHYLTFMRDKEENPSIEKKAFYKSTAKYISCGSRL
jgi:hypothetical protein